MAGLSPAGMAASLAALVRPCSCPASDRSWQGAPKTRSTPCLRNSTANCRDWHRYRQELVPPRWPGSAWRDRAAAEMVARPGGSAACQHVAVPDRHGGLRRRSRYVDVDVRLRSSMTLFPQQRVQVGRGKRPAKGRLPRAVFAEGDECRPILSEVHDRERWKRVTAGRAARHGVPNSTQIESEEPKSSGDRKNLKEAFA